TALLARCDKPGRPESGQLLAGGTRRYRQRLREVLDRRLPPSLQRDKGLALCRRQVDQADRHALHDDNLPGDETLCEIHKVKLVVLIPAGGASASQPGGAVRPVSTRRRDERPRDHPARSGGWRAMTGASSDVAELASREYQYGFVT